MPFSAYVRVLVDLAETLHGWIAALTPLDRARRRRVARYAARIADTLSRASDALTALEMGLSDAEITEIETPYVPHPVMGIE